LGAFAAPPWISDLSLAAYRRFLDTVIRRLDANETDVKSTDAGLLLVLGRLEAQMGDREALATIAQSLLRHLDAIPDGSPAIARWAALASMYPSQDAPALAERIVKRIVTRADKNDTIALLLNALKNVTRADPMNVWARVRDHLFNEGPTGQRIREQLPDDYLDIFGPNMLLEEIKKRQPNGPVLLAEICPIANRALHPLTRGLLAQFGQDVRVQKMVGDRFVHDVKISLTASLMSRAISMTTVEEYEEYYVGEEYEEYYVGQVLKRLREWERVDEPQVAEWAREVQLAVEATKPRVRQGLNGETWTHVYIPPRPQLQFDDVSRTSAAADVAQRSPRAQSIRKIQRFLSSLGRRLAGRDAGR